MKKDKNKIVITRDENNDKKVICRAFTNDGGRFTYGATCSPDDIFDFNIGAKLAMDRLYEGYDMTPKAKRKPYNGMIFIARYPGYSLRENTLYSVTNGIINDCLFRKDPFIYCDMSDEELSAAIYHNVFGGCSDDVAKCSAYFVEMFKWQIFEGFINNSSGDHATMLKIAKVFKSHDITVDETIQIMQEIAAVNQEYEANVVQLADFLKAKKEKK